MPAAKYLKEVPATVLGSPALPGYSERLWRKYEVSYYNKEAQSRHLQINRAGHYKSNPVNWLRIRSKPELPQRKDHRSVAPETGYNI